MTPTEIPNSVSWDEAVSASVSYTTRALLCRRADEWLRGKSTGAPPAFQNAKQRKQRAQKMDCQKAR